eukprot:COSAG05_NODE_2320_length_3240_cov_2.007641_3_plen_97_part_00
MTDYIYILYNIYIYGYIGNLVTGDDQQTQQVCDTRPEERMSWQRPSAPEAAELRLAFACSLLTSDGIPDESPLMFLDALDDVVRSRSVPVVRSVSV